jgi:phospholipase/carboxylesterase
MLLSAFQSIKIMDNPSMTDLRNASQGPHQGQPIRTAGEHSSSARAAVVVMHGRGARAEDILSLTDNLPQTGFAFFAPQAAENTWYPNRFLVPLSENEPWLSSALAFVGEVLAHISQAGIPLERTILLGFSQGACLTLEYAARNARRYGGLVGLSGALIGPDDTPRDYPGSLAGTPVFLGCSDVDFHVPKERVLESAGVLRRLGGDVTERLYPNMEHTINQDELEYVGTIMQTLLADT